MLEFTAVKAMVATLVLSIAAALDILNDKNIPDFTGVRIHDSYRDIIEVKPPFTKMFRNDGNLNSDFNDAWNQAERYLDFARTERDYLQRKGLRFDNPRCF